MMQLIRLPIYIGAAAFLVAGLLLGTLHAGAIPDGNLIQNPSFEVRSGPRQDYPAEPWGYGPFDTISRSPWAHWGYSGFFDGDYDIKLGPGHTGAMCARLVCRQRGRGGLCTDAIRVKPGAKLRFHGFFKGVGAKGACFINFEGDPGDGWATINLPSASDYDWTEITGEVTAKEPQPDHKVGPDGKISIYVFIYTKAYGELWIDDVTLTSTDAKQP
jgi:hypothetical protein